MDGVKNELIHGAGIAEAHFTLGRVNVDVDRCRVDVEKEAIGRVAAAVQHVPIGFAQGMSKQFVADETAVDVAVLGVRARP